MRNAWILILGALLASPALAQSAPTPVASPLAPLSFLVGSWQAEGAGQPGRSIGKFSFEWTADGHALLRHNAAAASGGRHADVMLVYAASDGAARAVYVDNEGHAIEYAVTATSDPQRVVFESSGPGPRFRLWYEPAKGGELRTGFEIAPAGASRFKTYLEGVARRQ